VPLALIGLWLGLSLILIACSVTSEGPRRWRWPVLAAIVVVLAGSLFLTWRTPLDPLPRWRSGLAFDGLAQLLLPPLWTGVALAIGVALFTSSGRYEPAIAALSAATATAGILSANALLTVALLESSALIILAGLLVYDQGLASHPLLNVATSLKYLTQTIVSAACLVMTLLLASFYTLNPDRVELPRIIAAVLVVGFGLAAGAMPFYFHVPDLFDAAPALATVSLTGPLQCLAFVYLIRTTGNGPWLLTDQHVSNVLAAGALAGALLASIMAFGQTRFNRLLAFNAMREVSWVAFGIASVSRAGWRGALIFLAVRCIAQPLLVLAANLAQAQRETAELSKIGGLAKLLPFTTVGWCAGVFASVGLPPSGSFWGLASLFGAGRAAGGLALLALAASGLLALWRLSQVTYSVFWGPSAVVAQSRAESPAAGWIIAAAGLGLAFAGVVPRLLQAPVDQLLTSFPFLR
jgi:formate hydrogenlyase subunit 3/multisubunit Na+/H+ antiporter MnhD subunit